MVTLAVQDGGTSLISLSYAYADGANAQPNDGINLTAITDNVTPANTVALSYTGLGRLQTANGPWGNSTYTHDLTGNLTEEVTVTGTTTTRVLAYPGANNKVSSETINGTLHRSFTYDGAGNTLSGLPAGASYTASYNKRNRPSGLVLSGSTVIATYLFNAQEQMASRKRLSPLLPQGTAHYIYDTGGHLIAEAFGATAASAVIVREYIWLADMPVAVVDGVNTANPVIYFVHTDHLARPIRMTDGAKATVWQATWTPWGTAFSMTGSVQQDLRFPGQYFLMEQGLAYNWHRFYDPTLGRYTQPDPLGFPDGPARYAYAINSPLMYTDEDGLCPLCIAAGIGALSGIGYEWWTNGDCATWRNYLSAGLEGAAWGAGGELVGSAILVRAGSGFSQSLLRKFLADEAGGSNRISNKMFRAALKKVFGNQPVTQDIREDFHRYVSKQGYDTFKELVEAARERYNKWD